MKKLSLICTVVCSLTFVRMLQAQNFSHADTLRGSITPERIWWDLVHYDLHIKVDIEKKYFTGRNTITYHALESASVMQIDLQEPMKITAVEQEGKQIPFTKEGNVWWIKFDKKVPKGDVHKLTVHFQGQPQESKRPPWDGGVTWKKDSNGLNFITTTCQGDGASLWWPCKDHMYDEADSMDITITVPKPLMDISNGRLKSVTDHGDGTQSFHWQVTNPINNYGVNINIGDYVHFGEKYKGEKGMLDCDYYVLRENLKKAKTHFREVPRMLEAFEHWFGPYPFYEDSYKLVEVPYFGMEHQSSVTYGNGYRNGYNRNDVSGTGWGYNFDFIIVHESGHEWFANNITYKDIADMWVHEGFTAYSENLFLDYFYGKDASAEYVIGTRKNIRNDKPIIGPYDVNVSGSGDMYYKGANVLHTLRTWIDDDEKWRQILRGLNSTFYHQTVTTAQIEQFLAEQAGLNLQAFFNQYLRDIRVPRLEYRVVGAQFSYRWNNVVTGFAMPIQVTINGSKRKLTPTSNWQNFEIKDSSSTFAVDKNYFVESVKLGE